MQYKLKNGRVKEIASNNKKIVLILGAGSTYSDCVTIENEKNRPPLDKRFFYYAHQAYPNRVNAINDYMKEIYDIDILLPENDSLENVLITFYTDIFNKNLRKRSLLTFQFLLELINMRIDETTHTIRTKQNLFLYQILDHFLSQGYTPENITIITYNYDIQIEKILDVLQQSAKWRMNKDIFNFPSCYKMQITKNQMLIPRDVDCQLFNLKFRDKGIKIFKLHGSINWYSKHRKDPPSQSEMFSQKKEILISQRFKITSITGISGGEQDYVGLPVIVPPVYHKSAILHEKVQAIWRYAEKAITHTNEILIFGYSCPKTDVESSNMLKRTFRKNKKNSKISIIDPSSETVKRYLDLLSLKKICYYQSAQEFLNDIKEVS
jgi:hypothetical protein